MILYPSFHRWEEDNLERYFRNKTTLSESENLILQNSKVCVVGCGGLGGYAIEMLARLGIGYLTAIDNDTFELTNLNRQILSTESNSGIGKALAAKKRVELINSNTVCRFYDVFLDEKNAEKLIAGHQVVIDALDNIPSRFVLQKACYKENIIMIHGAIVGWYGQVCTIYPGENTLDNIYRHKQQQGSDKSLGIPAFTPALISSIQITEAVKVIINRGKLLRNKLLLINLFDHEYEIIPL